MDLKRIILLIVIVALTAAFFLVYLGGHLKISSLKANMAELVEFYGQHKSGTAAIFITAYIVQTALSLPGAAVLSLAAGAVFGTTIGMLYVNIGATAGAALAFLLARYLFRDAVQRKFGGKLMTINRELERRGLNYLLFLRLVPAFPFFLINLGAGLTSIPFRTFVFGTMLGIIPGSFVFCNAGESLASIREIDDILSLRVLGSFTLLGLLALVPAIYAKLKDAVKRR